MVCGGTLMAEAKGVFAAPPLERLPPGKKQLSAEPMRGRCYQCAVTVADRCTAAGLAGMTQLCQHAMGGTTLALLPGVHRLSNSSACRCCALPRKWSMPWPCGTGSKPGPGEGWVRNPCLPNQALISDSYRCCWSRKAGNQPKALLCDNRMCFAESAELGGGCRPLSLTQPWHAAPPAIGGWAVLHVELIGRCSLLSTLASQHRRRIYSATGDHHRRLAAYYITCMESKRRGGGSAHGASKFRRDGNGKFDGDEVHSWSAITGARASIECRCMIADRYTEDPAIERACACTATTSTIT